jgi:hypothetical protein
MLIARESHEDSPSLEKSIMAVCSAHVMSEGQHAAEYSVVDDEWGVTLGVARPGVDVNGGVGYGTALGICSADGNLDNEGGKHEYWEGHQWFGAGQVLGLLLDCDAGTLTVKLDGVRLGVAATRLDGEWCWAAKFANGGNPEPKVRIAAADPATF